jgi:flagellar biosynthesis/type III secretory pathway chaperone
MTTIAAPATELSLDAELASLLERLSTVQQELLALLAEKRQLILRRDHASLAALAERERDLAERLQACQRDRQRLLSQADASGLPGGTLADLAAAMPSSNRLERPVTEARDRARLIRHECLSQWVVFQRSVLHLSQLLEIIATGGRLQPTYGQGAASSCGGALIDQAI